LATIYEGHKYLYLDIDILTLAIIESFRFYYPNLNEQNINRYIDDYIFIVMLMGNDFMPKCYWFSIQNGGYEKVISAYFQVHNHTEAFMVDTKAMQINTEMLADILFLVKNQEQDAVVALFEKRRRMKIRVNEDMTERERQQLITDCYPLQHLYVENEIEPKKQGWRSRYYKICLNMNHTPSNIEMVSQAYLKTLVWNFMYYFDGCISWDWYYPFAYSPTIDDIYNELIKHKNINCTSSNKIFHFKPSIPLEQQTLLLCVLPFASKGLMTRDVALKIIDNKSPMKIYFPKSYGLNVAFHMKYYECTPIIANIEIEKVKKFMNDCKMSDDEISRNIRGTLFYYPLTSNS
jgi:5'-3' exonuclease